MSAQHLSSLLIILGCLVWPSVQVCAPDCTAVPPDSGTLIRDPTDCTRYYVCLLVGGIMVPSEPVECPDGEFFNSDHTVPRCDPISTAPSGYCKDLCNPCIPDCRLDNPGTVQPDPLTCGAYFVCLNDGHILEEYCPAEAPFFDFLTGNCQTDSTLCYTYCDPCVPHCTADGEQIADPVDCHRFYICSPPNMASFLCPNGEVFDPVTKVCGDFPCEPACL